MRNFFQFITRYSYNIVDTLKTAEMIVRNDSNSFKILEKKKWSNGL